MVRSRSTYVKGVEHGAEHDANVLFGTWRLSRAVGALLDAVLAPAGLTADEFGVYSVLAGSSGITPTELARWMAAPPSTVSSYVRRFERRGHVERVANPGDLRSYLIPRGAEPTPGPPLALLRPFPGSLPRWATRKPTSGRPCVHSSPPSSKPEHWMSHRPDSQRPASDDAPGLDR
jgi:hypothetical protein